MVDLEQIKKHLINIPGWRTNRKIVVFESDDWGAIRMQSKESYNELLKKGIRVDQSVYDSKDCLATKEDIELLCDVLLSHQKGNSKPVFTFNTVLGNPDFNQIKKDSFNNYYREHFFESYKKYVGQDLKPVWFKAIEEGLIKPQFHGREHLNISLWMQALRDNHKETKIAFNHNFYGLKTNTPSKYQQHYLATHHPTSEKDFENKVDIIKNGLDLFEETFGYHSTSFIACNYVWPSELEKELSKKQVKIIQGQRGHLNPNIHTGKKKIKRHYLGQRNKFGQIYSVRNCRFEPTENLGSDEVGACLKDIKTAFRWKKPAIISSHRINYVSGMDKNNRDKNLKRLDLLLSSITNYWPDVEFLTTVQLGKLIRN